MRHWLFVILLAGGLVLEGKAQLDSLPVFPVARYHPDRYFDAGIGFLGFSGSSVEAQIGLSNRVVKEYTRSGYGLAVAAEWQPASNMIGWSIQGWYETLVGTMGLHGRGSAIVFQRGGLNLPALRPEAGISYHLFQISYGYHFYLREPVVDMPRHRLALRFILPIYLR